MGPLEAGQTVVIIGGGPGGVACALALKNLSAQKQIDLNVIIYEGKDFSGGRQYNQCAGVLSPPIEDILEEQLGVPFPHGIIQRLITGYVLYTNHNRITLEEAGEISYALRRIDFDNYFLNAALLRGVELVHARVTDLEFSPSGVMVYSESDNRRADVVVGAFGLDDGSAKIFERITPYRQPKFLNSIVTNLHPGQEVIDHFGEYIHAFLPSPKKIEFGAVTPKRNHLTINIAGREVDSFWMDHFLDLKLVQEVLPENLTELRGDLKYFKGKFPISTADGMYGDRYVIVGDAAGLVRPFKGKGVNAACLTGLKAAEVMTEVGLSEKAFKEYLRRCSEFTEDLLHGRVLRFLTIHGANHRLLDDIVELAKNDHRMKRALFDCVSARKNFREIYQEVKGVGTWAKLSVCAGKSVLKNLSHPGRRALKLDKVPER